MVRTWSSSLSQTWWCQLPKESLLYAQFKCTIHQRYILSFDRNFTKVNNHFLYSRSIKNLCLWLFLCFKPPSICKQMEETLSRLHRVSLTLENTWARFDTMNQLKRPVNLIPTNHGAVLYWSFEFDIFCDYDESFLWCTWGSFKISEVAKFQLFHIVQMLLLLYYLN